jgi:hypothetical protein
MLPTAPVKFQRVPGMAALPLPERGGDIKQLQQFTNLGDTNFVLFVTVLADALCPGRPIPKAISDAFARLQAAPVFACGGSTATSI